MWQLTKVQTYLFSQKKKLNALKLNKGSILGVGGVGEHSYSINSLTADLQGEFYDAIMTLTLEGFLYKTSKTQSCSSKSQPHKPEAGDCLRS